MQFRINGCADNPPPYSAAMRLRQNVQWLMDRAGHSPYSLADASGANQPTIFRILSGESEEPRTKTLQPIADYFGVSVSDLRYKDMTDGSLTDKSAVSAPKLRNVGTVVPVVLLASLAVVDLRQGFQPATMAADWKNCPVNHGPRTFAFRVEGNEMTTTTGLKTYPAGCHVYIDPDIITPIREKPALFRLASGQAIFAQYMEHAGRVWLSFLNDDYAPIYDNFEVIGLVIGKWEEP